MKVACPILSLMLFETWFLSVSDILIVFVHAAKLLFAGTMLTLQNIINTGHLPHSISQILATALAASKPNTPTEWVY